MHFHWHLTAAEKLWTFAWSFFSPDRHWQYGTASEINYDFYAFFLHMCNNLKFCTVVLLRELHKTSHTNDWSFCSFCSKHSWALSCWSPSDGGLSFKIFVTRFYDVYLNGIKVFFLNESIFLEIILCEHVFWQLLWCKLVSSLALFLDQMTEYAVIHSSKLFF